MSRSWNTYEGLYVGTWKLASFLGEREDKAFFVGQSEAREQPALVEVMDDETPAANSRRASWRQARNLSHKGLLSVFDTGEAELDGVPVAYAALDLPDDDLSEVLERRKLNTDEARSLFASVAGALDYLHQRGFHHDAVSPPNLFLVGKQVKLSVDTIAPAESAGKEADLREFGRTLVQAITGNAAAANGGDPRNSEAVAQLPAPFHEVAVGCLNSSPDPNWSAARIHDILSAGPRQIPPPQAAPRRIENSTPPKSRNWLFGVIGAVAAGLLAAYLFVGKTTPPPEPAPAAKAAAPKPVATPAPASAAPVEKPSPAHAAGSPAPAPATARRRAAAAITGDTNRAATAPTGDDKGSWAVIAATYSNFGAAEKRAAQLRALSPRIQAHVFPKEGAGKRYYVVLGSKLTQDAAQKLRELATSVGAPKDTYVTKLDES